MNFRYWCQRWGACRWLFNIKHLPDLPPFPTAPEMDPAIVELQQARHEALNRLAGLYSKHQISLRRDRRAIGETQ
jgi:hypothetical protein